LAALPRWTRSRLQPRQGSTIRNPALIKPLRWLR
jgi:hypothetical protein